MTDSTPRQITITNSQIGFVGDNNTIYGDIHFYQHLAPQPVDEATLNAALERLAAMPVDRLSDPGAVPPGSRMIFRRNPLFVGREDDLLRLAVMLKGGGVAAIGQIAAATGLGGIGKTQLAVEFVHRYGQFFAGGVFWLSFADPQSVPAEIAACGGPGALDLRPDFGTLPLEDQVRLVLSAWCGPLPRLLIFDNCEDEDLLARWLPPGGGARVLATSRRGQWNAELGVTTLRLDVLPRAESVALLRKHRPDLSDADANEIAEELGDLPLALHVAGSFLATYRHAAFGAPQAYLTDLRREGLAHPSLAEAGETLATAHARHVGRTFALSYERLNPEDPTDATALDLLARSAYFAPGVPIPRDLLLATLTPPPLPQTPFSLGRQLKMIFRRKTKSKIQNTEPKTAEDALMRLVVLGVLDLKADARPVLHRLLVTFVHEKAANSDARLAVEVTLLIEAIRLNRAGYPMSLLAWQQHLRFVTNATLVYEDEFAALLCNALGKHLQEIGNYPDARFYLERALAIREKTSGPNDPTTARSLNNLGLLLMAQGDLVGSRAYLERALEIREQTLGPDHPTTAASFNNLGALLQAQGDLAEAWSYYESALSIRQQALDSNFPQTATTLNNFGALLGSQGDLAGARLYLERALAIRQQTLGFDHPDIASSFNNLGALLGAMGDLEGARFYLERALAIREKTLGIDHPDIASSLNNLGGLLTTLNDLVGARSYFERALAIREQILGPDHPDTATILNDLGYLLDAQGDLTGALSYYERALTIREQVLGPIHPDTATSFNNLGCLLQTMGDLARARLYLERALAIREVILAPDHPDTANSFNCLGYLLKAQGDLAGARSCYEHALVIREAALGSDHPQTATSLNNLATLYCEERDFAGAAPLLQRALAICEAKLGPNHPNTQTARQNFAAIEAELHATNPDAATED